jgi:glycosyltransferase involved in cell wall biosynthesis
MTKVKIAIIGTRGIPANYGGFETFAEEVAVRMVELGHPVLVIGDQGLNYEKDSYRGVEVGKTIAQKPKNPLGFYSQSLKMAKVWNADFILMCGVGGTMLIPFYSSKKQVIAVNPDGLGFRRDKYPKWKKAIFYTQYLISGMVSKHLVCDSPGIEKYYQKKLFRSKNCHVIEYGTYLNPFNDNTDLNVELKKYDLPYKDQQYHLIVSRLEPENNVQITLEGYKNSQAQLPLVVVGNTNTKFSEELLKYQCDKIHFIGGVYDRVKLQLLRAASKSYWHGHSVGGTNPSLLEAMGSKNLCVCHDNIFNREVVREHGFYFSNAGEASKLFERIEANDFNALKNGALERAKSQYSWDRITKLYLELANETCK